MEYIQEDQILLYEELCAKNLDGEDRITKATIRFRENIKLVYYVTSKFSEPRDPAVDKEDIISSGYEGLWRACLEFDETQGTKFASYAVPCIKGYILRMLKDSRNLKVPKIHRDIRVALEKHGFQIPLSNEEIEILVSEGKFSRDQIMDYAEPIIFSLDSPISDDSDSSDFGEVIADPSAYINDNLSEDEIEQLVDSILKFIKSKNRDLVEEWMYSVIEGTPITMSALAKKYSVSKQYAHMLIRMAIRICKYRKDKIMKISGL